MDATSATSAATTASQPATSQANDASKQLSSNFDTFLQLLTTQLQNQDPLQPMDSNQFTQQLVQFSQVEQQINSNKNLESLIALSKASTATDAVSYLGKTVTLTDGTAALMDGQANWAYSLDNKASSATLYVKNMRGDVVYSAPAEMTEGMHSFTWDGVSFEPATAKVVIFLSRDDAPKSGERICCSTAGTRTSRVTPSLSKTVII